MPDLVGVRALAKAVNKGQGTISKHAAAGKIPIAKRDDKGNPLFDVDEVRRVYESNINPLMRRTGDEVAPPDGDHVDAELHDGGEGESERRSGASPRASSGLLRQQTLERQLRNRRLLRQIAEDEGLTVLRRDVELEQTTIARRTRDAVTNGMADKAGAAYAFAGAPRTEAEWRVWLAERAREVFNTFEATLALENDDEFDDESAVDAGKPVAEGSP